MMNQVSCYIPFFNYFILLTWFHDEPTKIHILYNKSSRTMQFEVG